MLYCICSYINQLYNFDDRYYFCLGVFKSKFIAIFPKTEKEQLISVNLIHYMDLIFTYRKIVDRIDTNKDGYVSHAELHYWIKHRQRRYIEENVNKHWKDYDKNRDGKISWEEYKNTTYGYYQGNII